MRRITTSIIALGFIGTMATAASTSSAQGIYFQGPGFDVGLGRPAYRERYYPGYYDYNYGRPTMPLSARHVIAAQAGILSRSSDLSQPQDESFGGSGSRGSNNLWAS
jgi:hypothetical protein